MQLKKLKHVLILLITILVIGAIFVAIKNYNYFPGQKEEIDIQSQNTKTNEVKEFKIQAKQFGYSPEIINVKKGERIKLIIDNLDTLHGIRIPDLGISGNDFVEFLAKKPGEFNWYCNNYCGDGHRQMQGKLIVE